MNVDSTESLDTKYGFVILLDALGARTASLDDGKRYLAVIREIEDDIRSNLEITLRVDKKNESALFDKLAVRFFGDTILITYEIQDRSKEREYFLRITFILQLFLCTAMRLGLLFRGSLSLGQYVDKNSVVLGPAVSDAASWYEELDMMGVVLTPHATLSLKSILEEWAPGIGHQAWEDNVVLDKHPLRQGRKSLMELFVVNWVDAVDVMLDEKEKAQGWFYRVIRAFSIPAGTETKYANTEEFFLRHNKKAEARREKTSGPPKTEVADK